MSFATVADLGVNGFQLTRGNGNWAVSSEVYPTGSPRLLPDTDTVLLHPQSEPRAGTLYISLCTQHPDHFHHMESFAAFPLSSLKYIIFAFFRNSLYFNFMYL